VLLVAGVLALPAPALGAVFYVDDDAGSSSTCGPGAAKCNLISEGLTRSRATPEADTIVIDPGVYSQTVDLSNAADAGLTLDGAGAGGGAFDPDSQTIVRATSSSSNALVRTNQDDVVLRDLRLDVPAPYQRPGLDLGGNRDRAENVLVELNWPDSAAVGVSTSAAKSGVVLQRLRVLTPGASRGVLAYASAMRISDSRVASGQQAVEAGGAGLAIARSHLSRTSSGAVLLGLAGLTVDSSLLTGGGTGLELDGGDSTVVAATLRGVTIDVGTPKLSDVGLASLRARAGLGVGTTGTALIAVQSSVLVEPQVVEGAGAGRITCLASDAPSQAEAAGPDLVSCRAGAAGNSSSSPTALFAPGANWRLAPGSPAADSGSLAALAAGESATDLDGRARVVDGNRDCVPRRDKGAYELTGQSAPCPPPRDPAPVVDRFSLTRAVFRTTPRGRARGAAALGTTFRWRLSEAAAVRIGFERRRGHWHAVRGSLALRAAAGRGSKRFRGRLRAKALPPGRYRATLVATDERGQPSAPLRVAFRVVRR
jgi:hypothetical protein